MKDEELATKYAEEYQTKKHHQRLYGNKPVVMKELNTTFKDGFLMGIKEIRTDYEVLSCSVGDFGELQDKFEEEQRKNNALSDNLDKAKEIIKKLKALYFSPVVTKDDVKQQDEILNEAEKFLSEAE